MVFLFILRCSQFVSLGNSFAAIFVAVLFMSFRESDYSWLIYINIYKIEYLPWWKVLGCPPVNVACLSTFYSSLQGKAFPVISSFFIWGKLRVICWTTILQQLPQSWYSLSATYLFNCITSPLWCLYCKKMLSWNNILKFLTWVESVVLLKL